jgi:hypothetical protein
MTTDTSIATVHLPQATGIELAPDAIATSSRADHAEVWDACIDALLTIWNGSGSLPEPVPTNATIDAVIRVLKQMRRMNPTNTPISIVPDPDGGIIVEWRADHYGIESITTVSFLNDGTVELTSYRDGVAIDVRTIETEGLS